MSLSHTSIYPYFVISALLLAVGQLIWRSSDFYQRQMHVEVTSIRFHPLDGLRGFLSLGVFFHHAVVIHFFYQHGRWEIPPSQFYTLLGQVAVALFFMITAFLFWARGLRERPCIRTELMLWSRLCRLVPMYVFSILCVLAVAAFYTRLELRESPKVVIVQILGLLSFGFVTPSDLNGMQQIWTINGNVQWSLAYEWLFYLFLPLGLVFARGLGFFILALVAGVLIQAYAHVPVEWNFLFGAAAAVLSSAKSGLGKMNWNTWPISAAILAILVYVFAAFETGYGPRQASMLFCAFYPIAKGNDIFGVLTSKSARLLGMVSYSIYLMHTILLFVAFRIIDHIASVASMSALTFWCVVAFCGMGLVGICALTYRLVEWPLMKMAMPKWLAGC